MSQKHKVLLAAAETFAAVTITAFFFFCCPRFPPNIPFQWQ